MACRTAIQHASVDRYSTVLTGEDRESFKPPQPILERPAYFDRLSGEGRWPSEGERVLPMLANPFSAVLGLILGLIGVIPRAIEGRQFLGRNVRSPTHAAIRRRCALLGECRSRRKRNSCAESGDCNGFEHRMFLKAGRLRSRAFYLGRAKPATTPSA
jgi:hypothetical protein